MHNVDTKKNWRSTAPRSCRTKRSSNPSRPAGKVQSRGTQGMWCVAATQRHLGIPLSRVTPPPMLNVSFHSAGESSARERKNGTRYRDTAREGRGGTRGPPGACPHTCFTFLSVLIRGIVGGIIRHLPRGTQSWRRTRSCVRLRPCLRQPIMVPDERWGESRVVAQVSVLCCTFRDNVTEPHLFLSFITACLLGPEGRSSTLIEVMSHEMTMSTAGHEACKCLLNGTRLVSIAGVHFLCRSSSVR